MEFNSFYYILFILLFIYIIYITVFNKTYEKLQDSGCKKCNC